MILDLQRKRQNKRKEFGGFMATVICVDGLGGDPEVNFESLGKTLWSHGHNVTTVDVDGIVTHKDRVDRVAEAYMYARRLTPLADIYLIGFSAGGSAVRILVENLGRLTTPPKGVILLSPAMPRYVWYLTPTLMRIMFRRILLILTGKKISLTRNEARELLNPISDDAFREQNGSRKSISGREARDLAFLPPRFVGFKCPVLHIYGGKDQWISARAQKVFASMLARTCTSLMVYVSPESGHSVLLSEGREKVIEIIDSWISSRQK